MKKQVNKIILLFGILCLCVLGACKDEKQRMALGLFSKSQTLSQKEYTIDEDSLAVVEGIICDGENLVIYDFHSGNSYTLFDEKTGEYITRFGAIGEGPGEILLGCFGNLSRKNFSVFNDQARFVMKYCLDSLRYGEDNLAACLTKYDILDADISKLIPIDDSTFVGAGLYKSRYQYLLFDKNNKVLDYGIDIYNAEDEDFNIYTLFLSNQGELVMHPQKKLFAYSVRFSANIDFFEIVDNRIKLIKSLRLGNPILKSVVEGGGLIHSADVTENTLLGYINLSATAKYVYALYSEKKVYESARKSTVVLAYDWEGNPVKKYVLDTEAYYIAVDEDRQCLFAAIKNAENGWSIICYSLSRPV